MIYAEIANGGILQLIHTNDVLPAHKLRPDLLPVVEIVPTFDPATERLGEITWTIEADRVVQSSTVIPYTPPPPERNLKAEIEFLTKQVAQLKTALVIEAVITQEKLDAHTSSFYRDNGDGTISLIDKAGVIGTPFKPGDKSEADATYQLWLAGGGKPLGSDTTTAILKP